MALTSNTELVICSADTQARHPELFHYTDRGGFEGIVRSNTFWASHYTDMADEDEVVLLRKPLAEAVAPRFEAILASMNRHTRRVLKATGGVDELAADFVGSLYGATFFNEGGLTALDAFSVSFSTHASDANFERENGLASQWQSYAGLDGYCLVFDTPAMARLLGQEMDSRYWVRMALAPVRYAGVPIEKLFPELVTASADTLSRYLSGVRYPEMAVPEFLEGATLLKGASFQSEREVRIVAIPGTKRLSDRAIIDHPTDFKLLPLPEIHNWPCTTRRYFPIFDGLSVRLPINRVIVGPSPRQQENALFARSLVGDIQVTCSQFP